MKSENIFHSMARANLNKSKKNLDLYYHSIKVHTQEAQNLHQLKFPLSDPNLPSKVPINVNIVKQNLLHKKQVVEYFKVIRLYYAFLR